MSVRSSLIANCFLMALLVVLVLGCGPSTRIEPRQAQEDSSAEIAKLADGLAKYMQAKGGLPARKEELQDFCSKADLTCCTLDWSRLSWESVKDETLVIIYDTGTYSVPLVVESDSAPSEEADTVQDRLTEQLRGLMK